MRFVTFTRDRGALPGVLRHDSLAIPICRLGSRLYSGRPSPGVATDSGRPRARGLASLLSTARSQEAGKRFEDEAVREKT